ncbi:MAG: FeoB-associated Cys-rich membrane protein [Oscillospiraceae bacterium]|jgi:hypothetical protein|nr:FeoB-associated Cys-rich membrane protein [Oscillospiraceae bacterium]
MPTIIIGIIVAGIAAAAVRSIIRDKKRQKASGGCDCGCGGCSDLGSCVESTKRQ